MPLASPIWTRRRRGGSGGASFNPSSVAGLQAWALSSAPYYYASNPVGGMQVLNSNESYGTYRAPRQGRCYLFDGVNDFATRGARLTSGTLTQLSAFIWVKTTSISDGGAIGEFLTTGNQQAWVIYAEGSTGKFRTLISTSGSSAAKDYKSAGIINDGNWHHVGFVFDNGILTIYRDGAVDAAVKTTDNPAPNIFNGSANFALGCINPGAGATAFYSARMRGAEVYTVAKTLAEVQAIYAGGIDMVGIAGGYYCNEEAGTTSYDWSGNNKPLTLTNITTATFHNIDTGVNINPANYLGFTLTGSTVIPRNEAIPAQDVAGGALQNTGLAPHPMDIETPCITGDGSAVHVNFGSALLPATANFDCTFNYYNGANDSVAKGIFTQWASGLPGRLPIITNGTGDLILQQSGSPIITLATSTLIANNWHAIRLESIAGVFTLSCTKPDGSVVSGSAARIGDVLQTNTSLLNFGTSIPTSPSSGRVANLSVTTSGATTYFPLQDGPGSGNTNRDLSFIKSDGSYGVVTNALVNGTVAGIWANRTDGSTQDWCINYGGRMNASGVFVPATLTSSICADGLALNLSAGKFGNTGSRLNANPFTAAEYNGRSIPTAYAPAGSWNTIITPSETGFRRTKTDGDDRFLIYQNTLTGADLTNVQTYVS